MTEIAVALVSWDEKVYVIDFEDYEELKHENVSCDIIPYILQIL